jgi:hypothetical protein
MLSGYNEPQVFSGHAHINRDYKCNSTSYTYGSSVSEKTIVGNWGSGSGKTQNGFGQRCMGDGSPFGFDVYDVRGANFVDHYFVDCTSRKSHNSDKDYVMRAYLSSDVYGGDCDGDGRVYTNNNQLSHERYFRFPSSGSYNYLHVNVFNGSPDTWTLKLYVNGAFVKNLSWVSTSRKNGWVNPDPTVFTWNSTYGRGTGECDNPWCATVGNSQDWWYIAYIINETASTNSQTTNNSCHHKWHCAIPVANLADIKEGNFYIEATHTEFGKTRVYRTNKIFDKDDYNGYMNYNAKNK